MTLGLEHFGEFMREVHGQAPFPWQQRLLARVLESGWPTTIKLPTASGKTAALDVAVFALAVEAARGGTRSLPIRIAFVVDRRVVVDGAYQRAERIRSALVTSKDPTVCAVAAALSALGGEQPLHVALLRGGIYREDRWARQPNQPTILCSTVDQVGSRLLHRGYGVAPATWPIHAGLLGNDTHIILDEAHCSAPFLQTLEAVRAMRGQASSPLSLPFMVTAMTATPRTAEGVFELDDHDRNHEVLRQRFSAPRPLRLEVASGRAERDLVSALRAATVRAMGEASGSHGRTVLVVANRVRTARAVFNGLGSLKASERPECILLTGRARPLERDALLAKYAPRLMAGRDRGAVRGARPLVVVATQCIEVGADLDVDALVTEACPLDALRQRLGRLNRLGELADATCHVVCRQDLAWAGEGAPPEDVLYGASIARTWHWLQREQASAPLDGAVTAFEARVAGAPAGLEAKAPDAPIVFPAYCDLWAQTGPVPAGSPEPGVFLHGPQPSVAEVQLVWRADLDDTPVSEWLEAVALCTPVSSEALSLPLHVARAWLDGSLKADRDDTPDVEGLGVQDKAEKVGEARREVVCWRGPERSEISRGSERIRPGDTLVVPSRYGGCDAFGWLPDHHGHVTDLADEARLAGRRAPALRLHAQIVGPNVPLATAGNQEADDDLDDALADALRVCSLRADAVGRLAVLLQQDRRRRVEPHPSGTGYVVVGRAGWALEARDFSDEDDSSSAAPRELGLADHLADVRAVAGSFGAAVGLDPRLVADLALAAHLHDLGKADPRFQCWLRDGDRVAVLRGGLLAKSSRMAASSVAMQRARERAGYPRGGRHELLSVRLAESAEGVLEAANDRDLVLHLVESHHGHCRPFAPVVRDDRPITVTFEHEGRALVARSATGLERLDSGVADRFFRLTRRYGWWGLSYLEAVLRLADHRASERAEESTR